MLEEIELRDKNFYEAIEIYNKFYVTIPIKKEGFDKISIVKYDDGTVDIEFKFNSNRNGDVARCMVDYISYKQLIRREKLLKIKSNVSKKNI
jgi:hypothetical protein